MPFSVKAKEFVPSSAAYSWSVSQAGGAADSSNSSMYSGAGVATAAAQHQKERVCMASYEFRECPFGDACAHAHHFTELSVDAQATLLATVAIDSIPTHFMEPDACPSSVLRRGRNDGVTHIPSFTPSSRANHTGGAGNGRRLANTSGPSLRPGAHRARPAEERNGFAALGASVFDVASTSSRDSSGNKISSKPASPMVPLDGFRMRLPARCRYPHKGMPGTYYSFLGVSRTATQEEIIAKYRLWQREAFKRMRAVDPAGAEAADRIIVEARNVLGNPTLRAEYDNSLAAAVSTATAATATPSVGQAPATTPSAIIMPGTKWTGSGSQGQTTTPTSTVNPNNVSSSAGTSISMQGRAYHAHSLSSSVSSVASVNGSGSGRHVTGTHSDTDTTHERLSPIPTLTTHMFTGGGIW